MSRIIQTITLTSREHYGRSLPPKAIGLLLSRLPEILERSTAMAFWGRSRFRSPRPTWLKAAADIRFLDHRGNDDSVLVFEAPTLGEAASALYRQGELWATRPDPDRTALDLLADVIRDIAAENRDSDRYDLELLAILGKFDKVLNGTFQELRLDSTVPGQTSAVLDAQVLSTANRFEEDTPRPQRVRVAGTLDMVRVSTQGFALRLDDGQEVRGVLSEGEIVEAAQLLNTRVLVLGKAVYRASGHVLRIDANTITPGGKEPSFWSRIPAARNVKFDRRALLKSQGSKSGMRSIMGAWPGDETDEQIQDALERLS